MTKYITFSRAVELLPVKASPTTLWRWATQGMRFPIINRIVKLEHVQIGRRMFTTEEWVGVFVERALATSKAQRQSQAGGREGRHWAETINQAEADIVLRRAGI